MIAIEDPVFRQAVDLLDAGDLPGLRSHLRNYPGLVQQRLPIEDRNYFRNPSLLEFTAENPIRHGTLPLNIVEIAETIVRAGADASAINETLGLVSSGRVPRERAVQVPLIELLCRSGADPDFAMLPALVHGEFEAVHTLVRLGAKVTLPVAAATGDRANAGKLLPESNAEERELALAFASQFGHVDIVRLLLDSGVDPRCFNPSGSHAHSTPLHQAAFAGHFEVVRLLVAHGANLDAKDGVYEGTPADWAEHGGYPEITKFLTALPRQNSR